MDNGKSATEPLLEFVVDFAIDQLVKYGEFYPFAGALDSKGEIVAIAGGDAGEMPTSSDVIDILEDGLRQGASQGKYLASALVYDARVGKDSSSDVSDTIVAEMEHRDGFAFTVCFPYSFADGTLTVDESFGVREQRGIFSHRH